MKRKPNLTEEKHTFTSQNKCRPTTTQNKHNKTKARFGRLLYDILPGNRESLFWFRRFINLSLTSFLDTYPLT